MSKISLHLPDAPNECPIGKFLLFHLAPLHISVRPPTLLHKIPRQQYKPTVFEVPLQRRSMRNVTYYFCVFLQTHSWITHQVMISSLAVVIKGAKSRCCVHASFPSSPSVKSDAWTTVWLAVVQNANIFKQSQRNVEHFSGHRTTDVNK